MTRIVFHGGPVHTPDANHTTGRATALCVEADQVVWIGDDAGVTGFVDGADRVVDLEGRLVTPAFVDAHCHLAQTGLANSSLDLSVAPTRDAALAALAGYARATTNSLILAFGWDETLWPDERRITRAEVDRAVGARPAYLTRVDMHSAVVSSAFLDNTPAITALEGYDAEGLVARSAHHLARESVFRLTPRAAREDAITLALRSAASQGIALVHELGAPHLSPVEDFETIRVVLKEEPLPEVVGYWGRLGGVDDARALGCAGAAGDLCVDGAVGSRTAAMRAPYADDSTSGHLYVNADQVRDHVVACTRADIQAGFHCIGDRAVGEVVSGFRQAAEVVGAPALRRTQHRLEHLEMASPEDLSTLGRLGVTASVQPMFDSLWGGADSVYAQRLGRQRAKGMNAYASMIRAGLGIAFGSDSPVTSFGPWAAVRAAVWHHEEAERITAPVAFEAHTVGGWRAARRDSGGLLEVGAPASLAVWDLPAGLDATTRLPELHPSDDLPRCTMTVVAGEIAFEEAGVLA